ncbi:hypothetical protein D3C76_1831550 [compost metagenome]
MDMLFVTFIAILMLSIMMRKTCVRSETYSSNNSFVRRLAIQSGRSKIRRECICGMAQFLIILLKMLFVIGQKL